MAYTCNVTLTFVSNNSALFEWEGEESSTDSKFIISSSSRYPSNSDFLLFRTDFGYTSYIKKNQLKISLWNSRDTIDNKQILISSTYRASKEQPYTHPFPPISFII